MWVIWAASAIAAGPPSLADVVAIHLRADGVVWDPAQLQTAYDLSCAAGKPLACKWRSWDDFGLVKRDDLARVARQPCADGDQEACLLVAWGAPGATIEDRVRQLEPPCRAGVQRACSDLGDILARDPVARPADHERALSLQHTACDGGLAIACRRLVDAGDPAAREKAVALGDPVFLPPREACDGGAVSGCKAVLAEVSGGDAIGVLERLCRMDDTQCAALAVARKSDPGVVPEGSMTRASWSDGAVLVAVDGAGAWTPHARIELATITHARIVADMGMHEHLVLLQGDKEIELPEGCDGVVAGAAALSRAGRAARAVRPDGNPTHSGCIDTLPPGKKPQYRSGALTVTSQSGAAGATQQVRDALVERVDVLYDCAEADGADDTRDTWKTSFVAGRDGIITKAKLEQSSKSQGLDACYMEWLTATDVGRRPEPLPFLTTVEITY